MLPVKDAESIIVNLVKLLKLPEDTEKVSLDSALGRILAVPVTSKLDFPYWDNSAMDGYAVRYEDVRDSNPNNPVILEVVAEIPAGCPTQITITKGKAARIFTGAMMPDGADTIVIQENTQKEGDRVKVFVAPQPQEFVRHKASFYQAGMPMLQPGIKLGAAEIAVLATAQCTELTVYRRPQVAILSTGNELVSPNSPLQPGQIVDSNQYALASAVEQNGAIPIKLGIVPDRPEELTRAIAHAVNSADMVLSTGGVSVGDYDYVDRLLAELGGNIHIRSVAVKPGKPLTVATFPNGCIYFGIPGNPVSALVCYWRFVLPALKKLSGLANNWQPVFVKAITCHDLSANGNRETYLWGQLHLVNGKYEFTLAGGSHSSGNLINLAQTNGLAVIPVGEKLITAGTEVNVMQIGN